MNFFEIGVVVIEKEMMTLRVPPPFVRVEIDYCKKMNLFINTKTKKGDFVVRCIVSPSSLSFY